ncbi:hypothetical protein GUITHDRAFT_151762, partial [Guillardia theta CCMP2712]
MVKCHVTKGLVLHVDAPVKQYIMDLDNKYDNAIVVFDMQADENKIFVNPTFTDKGGREQDTVE